MLGVDVDGHGDPDRVQLDGFFDGCNDVLVRELFPPRHAVAASDTQYDGRRHQGIQRKHQTALCRRDGVGVGHQRTDGFARVFEPRSGSVEVWMVDGEHDRVRVAFVVGPEYLGHPVCLAPPCLTVIHVATCLP